MDQTHKRTLGSTHRRTRVRHPFHSSAIHLLVRTVDEPQPDGQQCDRTGEHVPSVQESHRGSTRTRVSFAHLHNSEEDRRPPACPQPTTTQSVHPETIVQDGIHQARLPVDPAWRLPHQRRPARRFSAHPDRQVLSQVSSVLLERSHLPVPRFAVWPVLVPIGIYEDDSPSTSLGTATGDSSVGLPRRLDRDCPIPSTVPAAHTASSGQITVTRFLDQSDQISSNSLGLHRTPRICDQQQEYDTNHPSLQVEKYPERSISPSPQPNNHLKTAFLVHQQGPDNHFCSPSRAPENPATDIHTQPSLVPRIAMDQSDTSLFHGSAGTSVVDRPAEGMEWTLVPPRSTSSRSIHRRLGDRLGHRVRQHRPVWHMDHRPTDRAHQLPRIADHCLCHQASTPSRESPSHLLRQHDHDCLCQSFWRNPVCQTHESGHGHVEAMPCHWHPCPPGVHSLALEPCRPSLSQLDSAARVEYLSSVLSALGLTVGPPPHRLLRIEPEHPASDVHDMKMGSASICDGRTFCTLDNLASPISLSAVEPTSPHTAKTTAREGSRYVDNAQLVERPLVSSPPAVVPPANPHPSSPGPSRTRLRLPRSPEEPTLKHDRVGHKLRRLEDQGFDDNANTIILNRDRNHSRRSYNRIQRSYIDWTHHHDVDPFIPNPVHIVNYLAYGATHLKWKASTCQAYCSAILDLYSDKDSIVKDSTYIEFFSALNEQNLLSFHRPTYDIAPVIQFIHNLGPNDTINAIDLTLKLCWLLAIFDDRRTSRDNGILRLVIVAPKEKRSGRRIERVVAIQPHEDPLLCPIATYLAYKSNIAFSVCVRPHPVLSQVTLQRLKIPRPSGALLPKARTLGPTLALASGASVEDILVHGSWDSSAVFDTFYRLSRQTVSNFSTMTLTSSSGYLDTQPESLANEE
ncbi:hypothetical protein PHYBLDRAFT_146470 [Phycomyces blakesleeanus NRRL 1555(-)]|uniref:Uncharacterized protein n=1 Tax=Phycomyces blakesleeanus (strain ATCC 8743b / DSM 1359 / FGSC 10004 / NBRC 33097 / NRRL 1555) TaxID=763407 RepID=A0A167MAA8_PHYB8|nr:hypothetical protein PHYBLDRAFT_146470 [Phycomyces blakesleeanus NRRL 1555(-)]OAD72267.1 hypothetical protein PHYBLDRAFT_146470 [Phycomyces blakesleeanus NRRL 1555(-)]|eukprot:XP_018290307.1 hypothetical protein PHYBLDRAFT_146470 [Phycomyces blakesleeanus NRRL 1555(-)]